MRKDIFFRALIGLATVQANAASIDQVFRGVDNLNPKVLCKTFDADHMRQHPRQTVNQMMVSLGQSAEGQYTAVVHFSQRAHDGFKIRRLACQASGPKTICYEDGCDTSIELTTHPTIPTGIRLVNIGLRDKGSCESGATFLRNQRRGDDVFDLTVEDCE